MADITRRLKIFVNGNEVDATITNLRKNLAKFRAQSNRSVEGTDKWKKYNAEVAKTELELKQAYAAQKEFRNQTKLTETGIKASTKTLGDFTASLSDVFQGAKRGDFLQLQEGWKGVKSGIGGATKVALSFIATPIGAAIAVLAGIALVAKQWFNYNETIKKSVILTEQITRLQGAQADAARLQAKALEKTYGVDFKKNLTTARTLVENFKISYDEAFNVIEDGLIKGQTANEEYFQSLSEYSVFFKEAGFSATEFKNIISTGFDLGIYTDKLPDALKEADLALKEQTQTTRDALVNAFGAGFTEDILKRIRTGEITTKQALQEIAAQSDKTSINLQQNAQLTADIFKGAGEDAGGAVKIFEALNKSAADANRALTPLEASMKEYANSVLEADKAQDEAFKSDNFVSFTRDLEIFWNKTKTLFFNGVNFVTDIWTRNTDFLITNFIGLIGTAQKVPEILKKGLKETVTNVLQVIKTFGGLGEVLQNIASLEFTKASESAQKFKNNFSNAFADVKNSASDTVEEIFKTQRAITALAQTRVDERRAGNVLAVNNQETNSSVPGGVVENGEGNKLTSEDQKKLDSRKKLVELLKQFDEEQKIQEELKKLNEEARAEEEDVLRLELKFQKLIEEAAGEQELINQLEEAKQFELQQIRDKYGEERLKKQREFDDKLKAQEKKYRQESIKAEENLQRAKANARQFGLDTLRSIFGEETSLGKLVFGFQKALAIQEIIQSTAAANAKVSASLATANAIATASSPLTFGQPWVSVNSANAAKNIATNKINAAIQIGTIASTLIPAFSREKGGETFSGPSSGGVDGRGGRNALLHPGEYVIPKVVRQDPEVPIIIEYLEAKRTGQSTTQPAPTQADNSAMENTMQMMMATITRLSNQIDDGIEAKTYYGLQNERERQNLQKKLDETLNAANN